MSVYVISIRDGHKVACPVKTREEYLRLRDSSQQKANLQLAREGNDNAKRRLVQMNYSGHYPEGVVKGCKLPSMAFGFDLDDKAEFEKAAKTLLDNPEKYGLLMLERSARQGGHAVMKRERGKTILENQVRIARMLDCEMDTGAHDINRVYFTTTADKDNLLYLNDELFCDNYVEADVKAEAVALEQRIEELPPEAHKANKHWHPAVTIKAEAPKESNTDNSEVSDGEVHDEETSYLGIPYSEIINKWWELYNDGHAPVKSNRDVLTFELAVNLRHICGFDRNTLNKVIPCYDGFGEEQKLKCIDSALNERRTQMPKRMRDVLTALRQDNMGNEDVVNAIDEVQTRDEEFYYRQLPHSIMVQGVKDSIEAAGHGLTMPVLTAICPAIGALATGVKLDIHGKANSLNLISYIAGEFGSGKGNIDPIVETWMKEERELTKIYNKQHEEWRAKYKASKNKKEQPIEPKLPKRWLPLNNTVANLAEELQNVQGKHAFSFTPEADNVAQKWKSAMSDFSVMIRQSYDGSAFDREARSVDAVNVHIDRLLWNVVMCGTPDALYRVVSNYTDGFQSRIALARTPDNTFSKLDDNPPKLSDKQSERIMQVAHLLPLIQGDIELPKLEEKGRQWVEQMRLETMKNDDRIMARQRFRVCVTAQRMMCCLMLCAVCGQLIRKHGYAKAELLLTQKHELWKEVISKIQTPKFLDAYDVIADSLIENNMYFFREKIESAINSHDYQGSVGGVRVHRGKNDSIFSRLADEFSFEQALQQSIAVKGGNCTKNSVNMMLKNWKRQGIVSLQENNNYRKITN